jgi:RNA polymerase sigma-70 factor (ECF subfamily)
MTWPLTTTDEQAMWRVKNGADPDAFACLVRRWEQPIQRLCARMTGDVHRGEDLAQDAFSRVFTRRHDFETSGKFSTWLWRIAINLCHDELRRRHRRPEVALTGPDEDDEGREGRNDLSVASTDPSPGESIEALEQAEHVRRALQHLPDHYRSVVVFRHYEGLKFSEIAQVLGIPEGTVKSRMSEALSRLAVLLKPRA